MHYKVTWKDYIARFDRLVFALRRALQPSVNRLVFILRRALQLDSIC